MVKGSIVALVTPMKANGEVDESAYKQLLDWHIESGTQAIVPLGTTGEAATLSLDEKKQILQTTLKHIDGKIPVIAGTGTNATSSTLTLTTLAKEMGVDACLVVTPYYNKPTQAGLYEHYKTITENVSIPLILYNVPGRTACDMSVDTIIRLSHLTNIIGVKEASGDVARVKPLRQGCTDGFFIYSGEDSNALEFINQGGDGVISVTANVAPDIMQQFAIAALQGEMKLAQTLFEQLLPLHDKLFIETNPIPVKWVLQRMQKIDSGIRLPLTPLSHEAQASVHQAMIDASIL